MAHPHSIQHYKIVPVLEDDPDKREVGNEAVWTLSSAKSRNGVEQLRDGNIDTFWQSDGTQPHHITIHFQKRMQLKEIALYTDFKLDESYTPEQISVKAGTSYHDLKQIQLINLDQPCGWVRIALFDPTSPFEDQACLRAFCVQLSVLSSHQNGRDTHVRQVKIFAPRQHATSCATSDTRLNFSTTEFQQFSCLR